MHIERILPLEDFVFKREKLIAREPRKVLVYNGPKGRPPTSGGKFPDEVLLEIRRLAETENLNSTEIVEILTEKGLTIGRSSVDGIRNYSYRAMLVPIVTNKPYWPKNT